MAYEAKDHYKVLANVCKGGTRVNGFWLFAKDIADSLQDPIVQQTSRYILDMMSIGEQITWYVLDFAPFDRQIDGGDRHKSANFVLSCSFL